MCLSPYLPLWGCFTFSRPVAFITVSSITVSIQFVLFYFSSLFGFPFVFLPFPFIVFFFNYIKLYCYCLAPAVWGALRILFSYSHSFVCICICHISLIQFSISSYHLFFISHLCSYSIFYSLYRKYILRFLPNNSCLIYSSRASQGWNLLVF